MSAVEDRDRLEARLEALRAGTPTMPPDVERRIRARLAVEARRPARSVRRIPPRPPSGGGMAGPFLTLIVLLTIAGWVVTSTVLPVLRSGWEKNHCAPAPAAYSSLSAANAAVLAAPPPPSAHTTAATEAAALLKARAQDHCTR